jgi:hypothetical protein
MLKYAVFQNQLGVHCRNIHSRCHPSSVLLADTVMLVLYIQILYVYEVIQSNLREQGSCAVKRNYIHAWQSLAW